jgi:hypothetical protein
MDVCLEDIIRDTSNLSEEEITILDTYLSYAMVRVEDCKDIDWVNQTFYNIIHLDLSSLTDEEIANKDFGFNIQEKDNADICFFIKTMLLLFDEYFFETTYS